MPVTLFEILLALVFGTFLGIASYAVDRSRYGARLAREKIAEDVLLVVLWIGIVFSNPVTKNDLKSFIQAIVFMACTVLLWIAFIMFTLRRPQIGKVLVKLGRLNKDSKWTAPVFAVVGLGYLFSSLNRPKSPIEIDGLSFVAFFWSAAIIAAVASRKEFLVTEMGMQTGYTGFKWEDVKYYLWSDEGKSDHYLFFKLKHRPIVLNTATLKIPAEQRQAVSEIVGRYVTADSERLGAESRA